MGEKGGLQSAYGVAVAPVSFKYATPIQSPIQQRAHFHITSKIHPTHFHRTKLNEVQHFPINFRQFSINSSPNSSHFQVNPSIFTKFCWRSFLYFMSVYSDVWKFFPQDANGYSKFRFSMVAWIFLYSSLCFFNKLRSFLRSTAHHILSLAVFLLFSLYISVILLVRREYKTKLKQKMHHNPKHTKT